MQRLGGALLTAIAETVRRRRTKAILHATLYLGPRLRCCSSRHGRLRHLIDAPLCHHGTFLRLRNTASVRLCCVRIIQTVEQPSYMNWLRRRRRPSRQSGFGHHRALCRPIRLEVDSELRRSRSLRKKPSQPIRRGAQGILAAHIGTGIV
jgi:hypothetical protein